MNTSEWIARLKDGAYDKTLTDWYGKEKREEKTARLIGLLNEFGTRYGTDRDVRVFSVPGRSEIGGNHTDHNYGCVLCAAVDRDIIAVAAKNEGTLIRVKSEGFPEDIVELDSASAETAAKYSSAALVAGTADGMKKAGFSVGGFDAVTTSEVKKGSGISSSAAFEVMLCTIQSALYNGGKVGPKQLAKCSQYAENVWFGKPSGLMDQTACACGSFISIDFGGLPEAFAITPCAFDLTAAGYALCITDTGGNHADLNADYASVPDEMKKVAALYGKEVLRGLTLSDLLSRAAELRKTVGDRALMRAIHFVSENERVGKQAAALKNGDVDAFLSLVKESGRSSFMYLQNVFTVKNVEEQGVSLALCVTEQLLSGKKAAWRVHGGGFAGTMQAFVPFEAVEEYRAAMNAVFGEGACEVFRVRSAGASELN